jgi:tetratricopeptide (TPR) repeat protein
MPGAVRIYIVTALFTFLAGPVYLAAQRAAASDRGFVIEKLETNVRFAASGTSEREQILRVRIESDSAVRQFGVLSFPFDNDGERVAVDYVRVRKADGSTVETPESNFQETPSAVTSGAPMYSDLREKQIPVKALASGDTMEYRVRWVRTKPLVQNQFWYEHDFLQDGVVEEETLAVSVPTGQYIKLSSPGIKPLIREENGQRTYSWKTAHVEAINPETKKPDTKKADPAAKKKSPATPTHSVELTTFRNWEEVGRWYAQLAADKTAVTPAIQAKADALTKGLATSAEKERAIYDYVSTKFRYISVSLGAGRYQPHAAEEVMSNLYGDCKDKHTLLATLLKAAGIEAWPALIGADLPFDEDVPSPAQFNHVITVVPSGVPGEGSNVWLDSTPEIAPFGLLEPILRDHQALVIPSNGSPRVMRTPADPAVPSSEVFRAKAVLKSDGTLTGHFDETVRGDGELLLRSIFHETTPAQWQDVVQRISLEIGFGGKVSAVDVDNPQDTAKPFHYAYDYTREKYADWDNLRILPPFPPLGLPELGDVPTAPIELGETGEIVYEGTLAVPAGFSLTPPPAVHRTTEYAEYHATYSFRNSVLTTQRKFIIKKKFAPADQWEEYNHLRTAMVDNQQEFIQLTRDFGPARPSVAQNDSRAAALVDRADAALDKKDFSSAQDALAEAERMNPKQRYLWEAYSRLYGATSQIDKALDAARREVENHPGDPDLYRWLAQTQTYYHRQDDALSTWRDLLKVAPGDREAWQQVAGILMFDKRFDEAIDAAQNALKVFPDNAPMEMLLADALLKTQRNQEGIAAVKKAVTHSPEPFLLSRLALDLAGTETSKGVDLPLAREYAQRAVSTAEAQLKDADLSRLDGAQLNRMATITTLWSTVGWVAFVSGDAVTAKKYAEAAWKLDQMAPAGDYLGKIYEDQGDRQAAIKLWKLALAAEPRQTITRTRLEKADATANPATPEELQKMRTVDIPAFSRSKGAAEFLVLFSTKGVEDVAFISGENELRAARDAIAKAKFDVPFPDNGPEKIARRGTLSCSQDTKPNCQLTLVVSSSATPP